MSFIAEYAMGTPLLQDALESARGMVTKTQDLYYSDESPPKRVFWAFGGDFEAFDSGLETDSTVANFSTLAKIDNRRLYRVDFSETHASDLVYPDARKLDIIYLDATITHEGGNIRAHVPNRESLKEYRDACRERGVEFRLERIYHEEGEAIPGRYGLTDYQWEAVKRAQESGYFDQPRKITLEELAEEVDISPSAFGRRLRGGQKRIFEELI